MLQMDERTRHERGFAREGRGEQYRADGESLCRVGTLLSLRSPQNGSEMVALPLCRPRCSTLLPKGPSEKTCLCLQRSATTHRQGPGSTGKVAPEERKMPRLPRDVRYIHTHMKAVSVAQVLLVLLTSAGRAFSFPLYLSLPYTTVQGGCRVGQIHVWRGGCAGRAWCWCWRWRWRWRRR